MGGLVAAIVIITLILAGLLGWMYYRQSRMNQRNKLDFADSQNNASAGMLEESPSTAMEGDEDHYTQKHSPLADL